MENIENNELLQAIGQMLKTELTDVRTDIKDIKGRLGNVENRLENVEITVQKTNDRLENVESRLGNVEDTVIETKLIIENEIRKNINLLAEGHTWLAEKTKNMSADIEDVKESVSELKFLQTVMGKEVYK